MDCLVKKLKATVENSNLPILSEYYNNFVQGTRAIPISGTVAFAPDTSNRVTTADSYLTVPVGTQISLLDPTGLYRFTAITDWDGVSETGNIEGTNYDTVYNITSYTVTRGNLLLSIRNIGDEDITPSDLVSGGVYIKIVEP